tara:strand:- start:118 stop:1170 length:1053 start_codon:yes stop_codon:yes gene_type:complete
MKIINNKNEKSVLKKLFFKFCRKLGYEIVDQSDLFLPTSDLFANQNLSKQNLHSINIPLGKVEIKRKVEDLTIIVRSYTSTDVNRSEIMLDQNKERVFKNPKIEYTLRTIGSLIKSCNYAIENLKNININLIVTDDNSSKENLDQIKSLLIKAKFKNNLVSLKNNEFDDLIKKVDVNGKEISKAMISNMRNILKSIFLTKTDVKDLVYFVEDDYIHEKIAISEMLYTYERICSQIGKEIFLCPADYPYLYRNLEKTNIFIGNQRHWRTVKETLITFLTSKEMVLKYLDDFVTLGSIRNHPMEKKLHDIYEKELCLSPIPSLAMHATNVNSSYGIPPNFDWIKNWENNKIK